MASADISLHAAAAYQKTKRMTRTVKGSRQARIILRAHRTYRTIEDTRLSSGTHIVRGERIS